MTTVGSTSRDALRIAVLLTLLFSIAAVAVRVTISVIEEIPGTHPETTASRQPTPRVRC